MAAIIIAAANPLIADASPLIALTRVDFPDGGGVGVVGGSVRPGASDRGGDG